MPGNKNAYRLYSADGHALIDLMQKVGEEPPQVGQKVLCRHPFQESKRAYVIPSRVEPLYKVSGGDSISSRELQRATRPLPMQRLTKIVDVNYIFTFTLQNWYCLSKWFGSLLLSFNIHKTINLNM